MTYQRGDRVALVHTSDPHTRLAPGAAGTVTGYDPRLAQFSDRRGSHDASELVFCVANMSVMLTGRPGGSADERFRPGGSRTLATGRCPGYAGWPRAAQQDVSGPAHASGAS